MPDEPDIGASEESVRQGFESLATNTRALGISAIIGIVMFFGMLWGLWGLLHLEIADSHQADALRSAAPVLAENIASPLQPMPGHNDLDWQDLVHLRQREDAQFRRMGWTIQETSGEVGLPKSVTAVSDETATASDLLRFPPPIAPVRAGSDEAITLANIFPPVGDAAAAEQVHESIFRPAPVRCTGPSDVTDLPTRQGPEGQHDDPTASPPSTK